MKIYECRDQIQAIVDRACPDLKLIVGTDITQLNIQHCIGRISYHFSVDMTEWEKAKWPEHIVRMRLLDALRDLRDLVDDAIKEAK